MSCFTRSLRSLENFTTLDTLTQTFVADDDYHDVHRFDDGSYLVVLLEELYMDLTELGGLDNAKVLNPRMLHLDQNETVLVRIDRAQVNEARTHWPFLRDRRIDAYDGITRRFLDS